MMTATVLQMRGSFSVLSPDVANFRSAGTDVHIGVQTDSSGYARANFTPTDGGTITVRANTDDISATVEFTITTDAASGARDTGTGSTPGTGGTPGTISPVVHVAAASRPPMLWVDGGAIYGLVGADVPKDSHRVWIML